MSLRALAILGLAGCFALPLGGAAIAQSDAQAVAAADAQEKAETTETPAAPEPLTEDELEVLVSRIALYPDELV